METCIFVLTCKFLTSKHKNMHVSMYFFHLELTFTPHYIITDKGLLHELIGVHIIYRSAELINNIVCFLQQAVGVFELYILPLRTPHNCDIPPLPCCCCCVFSMVPRYNP